MSDDRELVERLAAIDATPRASWVAELRADLDAAWETGDSGYLDSRRSTTLTLLDHAPPSTQPTSSRRWPILIAAVLLAVVAAVVLIQRDSHTANVVTTPTPSDATNVVTTTTPSDNTTAAVESSFAAAIESAGLLIKPSAEEIALASDTRRYRPDDGSTQVSAADRFASLRTGTSGWAYVTGSVDGGEVHRGVLGEADGVEVYVLDNRFFVAMSSSPAPTAWLIDSVSGGHGELAWRDEPTTVSSREQALVLSEGAMSVSRLVRQQVMGERIGALFLPRVVDARDGTIRPLAVPDDASANLPVTQNAQGRIWIATAPDGHALDDEEYDVIQVLGLAYSDDGGTTWTEVTLPAQLFAAERQAADNSAGASITAEGDRIAITSAWTKSFAHRYVYVSSDAGQSWSTVNVTISSPSNGAVLYVLADGRLLLVRTQDASAKQLLASTGSEWTKLEEALHPANTNVRDKFVSVNRDGIVLTYSHDETAPIRNHFSTDLTNLRTIAALDD